MMKHIAAAGDESHEWRAMVLAAGEGTRLRPLTLTMPKAMVKVGGISLVERQLRRLQASGFNSVTVNLHHFAEMLSRHISEVKPVGMNVSLSWEREALLGTGGALKHAASLLTAGGYSRPVLIHNVDILSNADLRAFVREAEGCDAMLLVSQRPTSRVLYFNSETMRLEAWKNLKTGELRRAVPWFREECCVGYGFSGIHCIKPCMLDDMNEWPDEFSVIDFYLKESMYRNVKGFAPAGLRVLDVGKIDTLAQAEEFINTL